MVSLRCASWICSNPPTTRSPPSVADADRFVEIVALAAGGEADQLDRAAGERPGDVAAKLEAPGS